MFPWSVSVVTPDQPKKFYAAYGRFLDSQDHLARINSQLMKGAYTNARNLAQTVGRGYPALVAAIGNVGFPTVEVHISNPARRGTHSDVATSCLGTMAGFGIAGYALALRGLRDRAKG